MTTRSERPLPSALPAAWTLGAALALLPVAMHAPVSADRFVPLLFLPAWMLSARAACAPAARSERLAALIAGAAALLGACFLARNPAAALVMTAAAFLALAGGATARRLAQDARAVRIVLSGLLAGGCLGFLLLLIGWGEDRMLFPTYGSARLFGGHMFAAAAAGLALMAERPRRDGAFWLSAAGTTAVWTALAWSGSRAPALALAVMLALWFWREAGTRGKLLRWTPVLAVVALAASRPLGTPHAQMGWWPTITRTVEAASTGSARALTSERTDYWRACWENIRESPWIGRGADAYQFMQPKQPGNQPHNTYLQWWLELGVIGAAAMVWLLLRAIRPLGERNSRHEERPAHATWAAATMGGTAVYAAFEGVAFHMAMFMPLSVIGGLALASVRAGAPDSPPSVVAAPWRATSLAAAALLLVHGWLSVMLIRGRDIMPEDAPARLLRAFPSTTHGLTNWTERWRGDRPDIAREWIAWAQGVSPTAGALHVHSAQIHLFEKNWAAAEKELTACLPKVLPSERPEVVELLENLRRFIADPKPPPASATPIP